VSKLQNILQRNLALGGLRHNGKFIYKEPDWMNLKIIGLQSHEGHKCLAYTVMFDDLDRGRRMVAQISKAALIDPAAHPLSEGIDVEPQARANIRYEQYDTSVRKLLSAQIGTLNYRYRKTKDEAVKANLIASPPSLKSYRSGRNSADNMCELNIRLNA